MREIRRLLRSKFLGGVQVEGVNNVQGNINNQLVTASPALNSNYAVTLGNFPCSLFEILFYLFVHKLHEKLPRVTYLEINISRNKVESSSTFLQ